MWWFLFGWMLGSSNNHEVTDEEAEAYGFGCLAIVIAIVFVSILSLIAPHIGYADGFQGVVDMIVDTSKWLPSLSIGFVVAVPAIIFIAGRFKK